MFPSELHEYAYAMLLLLCMNVYCLPTKYGNLFVTRLHSLTGPSFVRISLPLVSYTNMRIPNVVCCSAKRVLFTNKLSEYWCHIIKLYPFIYQVSCIQPFRYLYKRVTQICMPYCNVWAKVAYSGFPKRNVFTKTLI